MTAALRYEWVRIRTIRSTYWLSIIAVVFGVGLSFLVAMGVHFSIHSDKPPTASDLRGMGPGFATQFASFGVPYFVAYILAMVAVLSWGHEYRHGMIRATLTALSSRTSAWVAKLVVTGVWVLAVTAATILLSLLAAWLWLHGDAVDVVTAGTWRVAGRTLLYVLVFCWLAGGFTALVRNQTAALVLLFLWPLAVETVVSVVFSLVPALRDHQHATRFLPFDAGARIVAIYPKAHHGAFGYPLSLVGALTIFGGLTLVALVASLVLFRKRDA
jgi:ABC-2 type transport system permease protein